jgi:23S rRNA pseudouridine1911/1915/1917 synthase
MTNNATITITKEEENTRLDSLICNRFSDKSRNYIQYLFKQDLISVNGKKIKKKTVCKEGDLIEILFKNLPDIKLDAEDIPLDILFEDADIIICNKPAGMVTHPAPGSYTNTFAGALLFYLKSLPPSNDPLRPGIVHRLDKDTSGVIIGAKTVRALTALQKMFAGREVKKTYAAICHGYIQQGPINAPIGRHPHKRKLMTVLEDGKESLTDFEIKEKHQGFSFIEARPHTGRTHQIRVHAKHLNSPVVGDNLYGPKKVLTSRQLLHAHKISFKHPFTEENIEVIAPIPSDMKHFWEKMH